MKRKTTPHFSLRQLAVLAAFSVCASVPSMNGAEGQLVADGMPEAAVPDTTYESNGGGGTWWALGGGSISGEGNTINSTGDDVYGIQVSGAGSFVEGSDFNISTNGGNAYGIYLNGGGQILLSGTIAIETAGANAHGVVAVSGIDISIGEGDNYLTGLITTNTSGAQGIYVANADATVEASAIGVEIFNAANILTENGRGIFVSNGSYSNIQINNSGVINTVNAANSASGAAGIVLGTGYATANTVRGNIEINNSGNITTGGTGLNAGIQIQHDWEGVTSDANITVRNSGTITTAGGDASALRIYSGAQSGLISIELNNAHLIAKDATGVKGSALNANGDMDALVVVNEGRIESAGDGITYSVAGTGNLAIENNGGTFISEKGSAISGGHNGLSGNIYLSSTGDLTRTGAATRGAILASRNTADNAVDVYIGYDQNGSEKAITGTIISEQTGAGIYAGGGTGTGTLTILCGDLIIKSGTVTPGTSTGSGHSLTNFGVVGYTGGTGTVRVTYGAGEIWTYGIQGQGIRLEKNGTNEGDLIVDSQAKITTVGSSAHGIYLCDLSSVSGGSGKMDFVVAQRGDISTVGSSASAIYASLGSGVDGETGNIFLGYKEDGSGGYVEQALEGAYTTSGSSAYGIYASSSSGSALANIFIRNDASITATGDYAKGIYIYSARTLDVVNTGNITTGRTTSYGLQVAATALQSGVIKNSGRIENTAVGGNAVSINAANLRLELLEGSLIKGHVVIAGANNTLAIGLTNQTIEGNVTLGAGTKLEVGFDENSFGKLSIGEASLDNVVLALVDVVGGTLFSDQLNSTYVIVEGAAVSGVFSNAVDGSVLSVGGRDFVINYSDTQVTLTQVPEPSTYALLGAALLAGLAIARRRKS